MKASEVYFVKRMFALALARCLIRRARGFRRAHFTFRFALPVASAGHPREFVLPRQRDRVQHGSGRRARAVAAAAGLPAPVLLVRRLILGARRACSAVTTLAVHAVCENTRSKWTQKERARISASRDAHARACLLPGGRLAARRHTRVLRDARQAFFQHHQQPRLSFNVDQNACLISSTRAPGQLAPHQRRLQSTALSGVGRRGAPRANQPLAPVHPFTIYISHMII